MTIDAATAAATTHGQTGGPESRPVSSDSSALPTIKVI